MPEYRRPYLDADVYLGLIKGEAGRVDIAAGLRIYRWCRRSGVTPRGMLDCMIAAVAWRRGAALLAYDIDLDRVAQVIGLDLDEASLRA